MGAGDSIVTYCEHAELLLMSEGYRVVGEGDGKRAQDGEVG